MPALPARVHAYSQLCATPPHDDHDDDEGPWHTIHIRPKTKGGRDRLGPTMGGNSASQEEAHVRMRPLPWDWASLSAKEHGSGQWRAAAQAR